MSPLIGLLAVSAVGITHADETELTEEFLNDPAQIALGQELFQGQCSKCHGTSSYPGKAPKLKPKRLTAEDVYLRMTYGWRTMPPWEDVLSQKTNAWRSRPMSRAGTSHPDMRP